MKNSAILFTLGLPGCGKGQLGMALEQNYHLSRIHLSLRLRGVKATRSYDELSETAINIVDHEIAMMRSRKEALYIDGFPRTIGQFDYCRKLCEMEPSARILIFKLGKDECLERCLLRRFCLTCQRTRYSLNSTCEVCGDVFLIRKDHHPEKIRAKIDYHVQFLRDIEPDLLGMEKALPLEFRGGAVDPVEVAKLSNLKERNNPLHKEKLKQSRELWMLVK